jgi:hypothetical protein
MNFVSTLTEILDLKEAPMPIRNDRCENCGASLISNRPSIFEMAGALVCSAVLIVVLTVAGFGAFQWMEHQERRFLEYPVWHEPFYYLSL